MSQTTILIEGLVVQFRIGVPKSERAKAQAIHIDISCELGSLPITRDALDQTLNYALIHKRVRKLAETETYVLLETLAEVIARICCEDARVLRVNVRIRKPNKLEACAFVGVQRSFDRMEVI